MQLTNSVIALNGLGIGFFNTYVELGQTFLSTYNENYIFGTPPDTFDLDEEMKKINNIQDM